MPEEQQVILQGAQVSDVSARLITKPLVALFAVFVFAVVKLVSHGLVGDYLLLLVGSLFSAAGLVGYLFLIFAKRGQKSILLSLVAFSGFVPYAFGAYLVLYRGLWSLRELLVIFSFATIVKAGCFVLAGYAIVSGIHQVTEFVAGVNRGQVVIK